MGVNAVGIHDPSVTLLLMRATTYMMDAGGSVIRQLHLAHVRAACI